MGELFKGFALGVGFFLVIFILSALTGNSFVLTATLFLLGAVAMLAIMEPRR